MALASVIRHCGSFLFPLQWEFNVSLLLRVVKVVVVVKPCGCCLFCVCVCVCFVPGLYLKEPPQSGGKFWLWENCSKWGNISFLLWEKFLLVGYLQSRYQTRGVSHYGLAIYIKKYLTEKEELWKFKYFTCKNIIFKTRIPPKETKILQDIITLQLISSFHTSQNITFQKSSYQNRPIIT